MKYFDVYNIDNQPAFDRPAFEESLQGGRKRITVEDWSDLKERTAQQTRWWKGVLLKELAKDSGDSTEWLETKLKMAVMPEEFTPVPIPWGKKVFLSIPSITVLSCKKMNELIEGSVQKCHDWGFIWVTLPDSELRK